MYIKIALCKVSRRPRRQFRLDMPKSASFKWSTCIIERLAEFLLQRATYFDFVII